MFSRAAIVALTLVLAPPAAQAADLVVWWDRGFYDQEDEALAEVIAAFEHGSGRQVELILHPVEELPFALIAAFETGRLPDFAFGLDLSFYLSQWAYGDRLVDLREAVGALVDLFDPDVLNAVLLHNGTTGQEGLYGLPMGRSTVHIHVWTSLLESAGLSLADIPDEWEAFWSFWCDEVQQRCKARGRDDVWGTALVMSPSISEAWVTFSQFRAAHRADYVTPDGRLLIDDPEIRQRLVKALHEYTEIYRKGCTPPDAVVWQSLADNNRLFLAQGAVMTPNETLSIPNALRRERPEDYHKNVATIAWPLGPDGEPFPIFGDVFVAIVPKGAANIEVAEEFVRFLMGEGWLMHYLNFSAERLLPPIAKLLDQPFWLDARDPHRMAAVMQVASRPLAYDYAAASGNWRHDLVEQEHLWAKAIQRVVAEDVTPEQAVDEAIARIKEILAE
jgi:multiple sugar transport system substrate-binding protein